MEIKKGNNIFYIGDESQPDAKLTFEMDEEKITVFHVGVSEKLRGQGIAKLLVDEIIVYAKENNKKILPLCSYVKKQMERNYNDMIYGNVDEIPDACSIQF